MTFAIAGFCERTGMLGVVVTTSSICVGSRCPWVRARVGAVSTQNITLPSLGRAALDQMESGLGAKAAVREVMKQQNNAEYRQLVAIDRHGEVAQFTGDKTLGTHSVAVGQYCVAGGNLLSDQSVPRAMVNAFVGNPEVHLADRLITALESGVDAGGEEGPTRSAALLVAHEHEWPLVDLRVDWDNENPVSTLRDLWTAYESQMNDYLLRALDPASAPSYGVPGDE